jgi:hypothetical protein
MKLLSKTLEHLPVKNFQFRTSPFSPFAVVLVLVFIIAILSAHFLLGRDARIANAIQTKQRVEVSLKNSNVIVSASQDSGNNAIKSNAAPETNSEKPAADDGAASSAPADAEKLTENEALVEKTPDAAQDESAHKNQQNLPDAPVGGVSAKETSDAPLVVIIIKGLGLSSSSTREALDLPKEITMGFSPYSPSLDEWVKKSKELGHESILNIPMETKDYRTDNPGPYSLLAQSSAQDNATRLKMLLGLTKDYNAIYSESSEAFTSSADNIKPVLEILKKENKYFVYGGGYANYALIQVANGIDYPILVNDLVLDDDISTSAINEKFNEIEKIAKDKGYVVVMAHPYPITLRMLTTWLQKMPEKGLLVSPISKLLGKTIK